MIGLSCVESSLNTFIKTRKTRMIWYLWSSKGNSLCLLPHLHSKGQSRLKSSCLVAARDSVSSSTALQQGYDCLRRDLNPEPPTEGQHLCLLHQPVWSQQILSPNNELGSWSEQPPCDGFADIIIIDWVTPTDEWIRHHLPPPSTTIYLHSNDLLSNELWNFQTSEIKQTHRSKLS